MTIKAFLQFQAPQAAGGVGVRRSGRPGEKNGGGEGGQEGGSNERKGESEGERELMCVRPVGRKGGLK